MPVRLFVGNLPYNVSEAELREHFSAAGEVSYLSLPTDRETGKLRGFAFVDFHDRAQAEDAIHRFHNQLFKGRPIAVSVALAREDRPPNSGSPRPSGPRSNAPRLTLNVQPESDRASGNRQSRDFGPDAPPQIQRNKKKSGPRPERGPKGPMREMSKGQFYAGGDDVDDFDDDDVEDFYEDVDDLYEEEPENESNEENLASHQSDVKGENN